MRVLRRIIVALIIFAGLLVVVDRGAVWLAERQLAERVGDELVGYGVATEPDVNVEGFPFLTQVSNGTYEKITVDIGDVLVDGWKLERATLTAHSVDAPVSALLNGSGSAVAKTVGGEAVIAYDVIESLSGEESLELSKGDGPTVDVTAEQTAFGTAVSFTGSGDVTITDGVLEVEVSDVEPTTDVEVPPVDISFDLPAPSLPYGLEITEVRPTADGLEIALSGRDVPLSR